MKEGHEEVGLLPDNIKRWWFLTSYRKIYMYAAEIINKNDFDQPHYETGAVAWLSLPQDLNLIRKDQQIVFEKLMNQLIKK
jgi:hypothetical protein